MTGAPIRTGPMEMGCSLRMGGAQIRAKTLAGKVGLGYAAGMTGQGRIVALLVAAGSGRRVGAVCGRVAVGGGIASVGVAGGRGRGGVRDGGVGGWGGGGGCGGGG